MSAEAGENASTSFAGSVLRGGAWQSTSRVLLQLYTIFISIVAARYLGAAGMGRLVLITYAYTTLVALLTAGLPVALNRFSAEAIGGGRARAIHALYRWARAIEMGAASLGAGILISIALLGAEPRGAWLAAAVAGSASILQTLPNAILLGSQRWRQASVVGLVTGAAGGATKLLLLWSGKGIVELVAVDACVAIANLVFASFFVRRTLADVPSGLDRGTDLIARARRYALASSVSVILAMIVLQRSEVLFLQQFTDDVQIALYSIPFSALEALNLIPGALALAAASVFATLFGAGALERIRDGFGRAVRLTLLATVPMAAAGVALGPTALRLAYGDEYDGTAPVLTILILSFPIVSIMFISSAVVQGFGEQRVPLLILGAAAIVNVLLGVALIPRHGAVGAAIACSAAQSANAIPLLLYAAWRVGGVAWEAPALVRLGATSAAASLAAAATNWWLAEVRGFLAGGCVFAVSFVLIAVVLRVIAPGDAAWLERMVGSRLGGRAARTIRWFALTPASAR